MVDRRLKKHDTKSEAAVLVAAFAGTATGALLMVAVIMLAFR